MMIAIDLTNPAPADLTAGLDRPPVPDLMPPDVTPPHRSHTATQPSAADSMTRRSDAKIWVVVPAYNEQPRLERALAKLVTGGWQIVVVDDGSSDSTAEIAARFPVWIVRHPINCGQGAALKTGFDFACQKGAEIVVTYDADGQHDAAQIDRLIQPILRGEVDVVLGSRFLGETHDMPWTRWLVLKGGIIFTKYFSGISLTDTHNGFRAFSRRSLQKIQITHSRMAYASEILEEIVRHQLSYTEVPVTISYSKETLTKGQSSWEALRITWHLLTGRYLK